MTIDTKTSTKRRVGTAGLAAVAGLAMLATVANTSAALADEAVAPNGSVADQAVKAGEGRVVAADAVELDTVEGTFAFSQTALDDNDQIRASFADASKYLCSSQYASVAGEAADPLAWSVSVGGEVDNAFTATISEMADEGGVHNIMGCTCLGNPVDGRASVNAGVTGISMAYVMDRAGVSDEANTVVFTSSDGYQIALPLSYVKYRFSIIAYDINGEPLRDVLGCSNQLWLGSTSANYFTRDVVSIDFETRQTPPPVPFTEEGDEYYGNLPNVAVTGAQY